MRKWDEHTIMDNRPGEPGEVLILLVLQEKIGDWKPATEIKLHGYSRIADALEIYQAKIEERRATGGLTKEESKEIAHTYFLCIPELAKGDNKVLHTDTGYEVSCSNGTRTRVVLKDGTHLAKGFHRYIITDRGAFLELEAAKITKTLVPYTEDATRLMLPGHNVEIIRPNEDICDMKAGKYYISVYALANVDERKALWREKHASESTVHSPGAER